MPDTFEMQSDWNVVIATPARAASNMTAYHRDPLYKGGALRRAFQVAAVNFDIYKIHDLKDPQGRIVGLDLYTRSPRDIFDMLGAVHEFTRNIIGAAPEIEICALTDASPQAVYF